MPDSKRKNLSISPKFAEHIHQVYEQELEDKIYQLAKRLLGFKPAA